ncbi:hydrogen peroxide-inducible genes activator [Aestuariispira insulae]|uniref:Transcriptional regulator n=1 Tax=Aestuariispira insulae TaxID=1461337 RepID=A0A3D9HML6_9PROT|nr:hydrogen peroxide-inducible genes activator [Aestuariispira insulae]RED50742.1 transcriptional regulator [Aestuariispira insulae]
MKALPTLKQLRHLVAVAEFEHFGKAAEACFVTQSTLSASIKELETILGSTLIERTKRSVMVTALGLEVVERSRNVLRDVEDIVDLVAGKGEPLTGNLRMGVIPTISPFLLPRVMPTLRRAHPELRLYLREDQTARILEKLGQGDLDLVLIALPYPMDGIETLTVADDPFFVAFPKGHRFENREMVPTEALAEEELLLLEEGHCLREHALSACQLITAPRREDGFQATSLYTLVQMVESGLGLTLLPKMAVDAGLLQGTKLQIRPLEGRTASREIGLAWRKSSSRDHEYRMLGDILREELATPVPPTGRKPK